MTNESVDGIMFWKLNVRALNDIGIFLIDKNDHECMLFCDANSFGYDGYLSMSDGAFYEGTEVIGTWGPNEMLKSSTWREVEAVHRVIKTNERLCKGKKVKCFSVNKNVIYILISGSKTICSTL